MEEQLLKDLGIDTGHNELLQWAVIIIGAFLLFYICEFFSKKVVIPIVRRFTNSTASKWDDILLNNDTLKNLCRLVPGIIASFILPFVLEAESTILYILHEIVQSIRRNNRRRIIVYNIHIVIPDNARVGKDKGQHSARCFPDAQDCCNKHWSHCCSKYLL